MLQTTVKFAALALTAACALNVHATDLALLRNGFEIRHQARESVGEYTRLYLDAGRSGYVEVRSDQIVRFEKDASLSASSLVNQPVDIPAVVAAASTKHGIDADLIAGVIQAESAFDPRAVSPKGAQGLMQLMPSTASELGVKDSFDAYANVDAGTRYLRELLLRYNEDVQKALAAYNAGPHRVDFYNGVPPYRETRQYVTRIIREFNRKKLATAAAAEHTPYSTARARDAKVAPNRVLIRGR